MFPWKIRPVRSKTRVQYRLFTGSADRISQIARLLRQEQIKCPNEYDPAHNGNNLQTACRCRESTFRKMLENMAYLGYTDIQELTPEILREFIDKIVIHERSVKHGKYATQQIDIYYNFVGLLQDP